MAAALNWLARHQNPDGSWSAHQYRAQCRGDDRNCSGPGAVAADAAGTALALLSFLGAGQTHQGLGPYKTQITKAVDWLIQHQNAKTGDLAAGTQHQMYSHGMATIALCEAFGMTGDPQVGKAARRAVEFIQAAQNRQGGWRYRAGVADSDTSVTGWADGL